MTRIPTNRAPTHPGKMLLEEFLLPMSITQRELASAIHVPYQRVNELINGKWQAGDHPKHSVKACPFLWHVARLLAQSATALGFIQSSASRKRRH